MAVDLSRQMGDVVSGWRRRGFDVGCGMGIAYGYATIGPVGFDERTDYTALGPTVNLASRLCAMAADGEILVDGRAHEAVEDRVEAEERVVAVRGFRLPVHAYNVTAWRP
jgi:class 3 adenylate cyclase